MISSRQLAGKRWFRAVADVLPDPVRNPIGWLQLNLHRQRALRLLRRPLPVQRLPHGLPGELIVSLTSYPARFATLHLTLRSLLAQSVRPDRLLLWIAHGDANLLPKAVRALEEQGLSIRLCDDLRSYKKLVPALDAFPNAFIVTADDDLYYPPPWLAGIIEGVDVAVPAILARRAHRLKLTPDGRIKPYLSWDWDVQDDRAYGPSPDIMPTSGAGALYPPHSLHPIVTDRSVFKRLCPDSDDLWFYWCARMAGTPLRKVGGKLRLIGWAGSQQSSLWENNRRGGNDRMIRRLEAEFGIGVLGLDGKPLGS